MPRRSRRIRRRTTGRNGTGQRRQVIIDALTNHPQSKTVLIAKMADRFDLTDEAAEQSVSAHLDRMVTEGVVIFREDLYEAVRERF